MVAQVPAGPRRARSSPTGIRFGSPIPAGMLPGSRLLDGPPHRITPAEVIKTAKDYEFRGSFHLHRGFHGDLAHGPRDEGGQARPEDRLRRPARADQAGGKPAGELRPSISSCAASSIMPSWSTRKGKPLSEIRQCELRERRQGGPQSVAAADADRRTRRAAVCDGSLQERSRPSRNTTCRFCCIRSSRFYTTRGCPALCTFCLWPQTLSGHAWRKRSVENVARELRQAHKMFPQVKEFFFDDDTFNIQKDRVPSSSARKFKPLGFTWSCTSRVHHRLRNAEGDEGCRLPPADRRLRIGRRADSEEHQDHLDGRRDDVRILGAGQVQKRDEANEYEDERKHIGEHRSCG